MHVKQGKGRKDRYTILSDVALYFKKICKGGEAEGLAFPRGEGGWFPY